MNTIAAKQIMKQCTGLISLNPPFNSASPRNTAQAATQTPGPGSYNIPSFDYQKTQKYHIKLQNKTKTTSSFQWMFNDTRSKSLGCNYNNRFIGPGSYEISRVNRGLSNNSWDKSSRFFDKNKDLALPGPGAYSPSALQSLSKNRNSYGSIFKSKSPRTQKHLFQHNQQEQRRGYKSRSYFTQEKDNQQLKYRKKQQAISPFFSSKVPRFKTQSQSSQIGPGSYNFSLLQKMSLKPQRPCLVRTSNHLKSLQLQKLKKNRVSSDVGPGSYNMDKYEMSRIIQYKGVPFPRQTRFNFTKKKKSQQQQLPGPGHYMTKKYQYLKQKRSSKLRHHKMREKIGRHMKQTLRKIKSEKQINQGPGSYNLNYYDIESKVQKKKEFAQKLKLMEIALPAFNSKVPRVQ